MVYYTTPCTRICEYVFSAWRCQFVVYDNDFSFLKMTQLSHYHLDYPDDNNGSYTASLLMHGIVMIFW